MLLLPSLTLPRRRRHAFAFPLLSAEVWGRVVRSIWMLPSDCEVVQLGREGGRILFTVSLKETVRLSRTRDALEVAV